MAFAIPDTECRRAHLHAPCWIVVDEYNKTTERALFDFESLAPLGAFSPEFLKRIASAIAQASKSRRLKAVSRA